MRVVITGASSGIGWACAERLARGGHEVLAAVRGETDLERVRAAGWRPLRIDVTDEASVRAAAAEAGPVDGLVNNAGLSVGGPVEFVALEDLRRQLEVNVIGQVAVTQAFLAGLRERRGRVVFMGSIAGVVALPVLSPYAMSKFALEALGDSLRREVGPLGVRVSIVRPGSVATPIWEKGLADARDQRARMPPEAERVYGRVVDRFSVLAQETGAAGIPPDAVAEVVEHALTAKRPRTRYLVGNDARSRALLARLVPDRVFDRLIAKTLGV